MTTRRKGEPIACGRCLSFDIVVGGRSWQCLACDDGGRLPEVEALPVEDELADYLAQPALLGSSTSPEGRMIAARLLLAFFGRGRGEARP
ncbi:hypothetical protein [Polyangium sorediatum]|uniref:Uncharacterized protein n=1 Tax=Polyangium sorediatum TaxID=889274 RepID=A0ABT6NLE8_9BACT|nr:hypothetical protein [Polyangium sorediatum]MDI1429050.1 hypothetical protein [Polyangium sorediatum]